MDENLNRLGLVDDADIILDEAALLLALPDHVGIDLRPYQELLEAVAARLVDIANVTCPLLIGPKSLLFWNERRHGMPFKKHRPEEIIGKLREAEIV
ncbi:MAG: hypothetical protein JWL66_1603, partial [Sphingomonadales bacterium]|nr:hypothetical protein [Sphingomonadales bacterium]